jgi:hypothetical protein
MNALAGGASFVTLPALIAAGVPSVNANTTSTVALYPGQLTSSWAYRDGLGPIGSVPLRRRRWRIGAPAVLGVQFCLGIYGGYFGGGVGIMMMAVWSLLTDRTLKSFNAPRTLLVSAANAIAVLIFIAARAVYWREAWIMLATAMLGAYCGSLIGRRAPVSFAWGPCGCRLASPWHFLCARI